jgi:hypothetical protein
MASANTTPSFKLLGFLLGTFFPWGLGWGFPAYTPSAFACAFPHNLHSINNREITILCNGTKQ